MDAAVRAALPGDHAYRLIIHDRDRIFAEEVDCSSRKLDLSARPGTAGLPAQHTQTDRHCREPFRRNVRKPDLLETSGLTARVFYEKAVSVKKNLNVFGRR
jgi:hypothetical protein